MSIQKYSEIQRFDTYEYDDTNVKMLWEVCDVLQSSLFHFNRNSITGIYCEMLKTFKK